MYYTNHPILIGRGDSLYKYINT